MNITDSYKAKTLFNFYSPSQFVLRGWRRVRIVALLFLLVKGLLWLTAPFIFIVFA